MTRGPRPPGGPRPLEASDSRPARGGLRYERSCPWARRPSWYRSCAADVDRHCASLRDHEQIPVVYRVAPLDGRTYVR